jgi:hypothetical protein
MGMASSDDGGVQNFDPIPDFSPIENLQSKILKPRYERVRILTLTFSAPQGTLRQGEDQRRNPPK